MRRGRRVSEGCVRIWVPDASSQRCVRREQLQWIFSLLRGWVQASFAIEPGFCVAQATSLVARVCPARERGGAAPASIETEKVAVWFERVSLDKAARS